MKLLKTVRYLLLSCALSGGSVFAVTVSTPETQKTELPNHRTFNHFDLLGSGGMAAFSASDSTLGLVSGESDRLTQTNSGSFNAMPFQGGIGYLIWLGHAKQYSTNWQWLTSIEPQINGFYVNNWWGLEGDVNRSTGPSGATYTMLVQNIRIMADVALTIGAWRWFSIYGIGGIGVGWNGIKYRGHDGAPVAHLDNRWTTNFVGEVGPGLNYAMNDRASFFFEYLYTWLGNARTATSSDVVSAAKFNLNVQQILWGMSLALY